MNVPNANRKNRRRRREAGAALLISLFVLLLIAVVAIALIVASGTETALTGNYHSATAAYYAAVAGLEEGRGRLLATSPDYFNKTSAGFIPAGQVPANLVSYILNPVGGEVIDPTDLSAGNPYADREYATEFPAVAGKTVQSINSVYVAGTSGLPGPLYKWVRITAATEYSLGIDINGSVGGLNQARLTYYDPAHVDGSGNITPSLISVNSPPGTAVQVFQITALAVLPNGSQKMLQYVVAGGSLNLQFPAALTFVGTGVQFIANTSVFFAIDGNDQFNAPGPPPCAAGAPAVAAVGYTSAADGPPIQAAMSATGHPGNYRGAAVAGGASLNHLEVDGIPPPTPKLPPNMQTASGLASIMQTIRGIADLTSLPASMSPSSPKTIFINGDLDMTGWTGPGYGLLAVTGNLKYDGNVTWKGIILVVGQGTVTFVNSLSGEMDGALLVAQLPGLGPASVDFSNAGNGVFYSNCWIQAALPTVNVKVLSFREISQ